MVKIIKLILICALGIGIVAGVATLVNRYKADEYKTVVTTYTKGDVTEQGAFFKTDGAIISDSFACIGLTVTPKFDSQVKYKAVYYAANGNYISQTGYFTDSQAFIVPTAATEARIVIMPKDGVDEDGKISLFERFDYVNDIKIEVYKNQPVYEYGESVRGNVDFIVVSNIEDFKKLDYKEGYIFEDTPINATDGIKGYSWADHSGANADERFKSRAFNCALLKVKGGEVLSIDNSVKSALELSGSTLNICVAEFTDLPTLQENLIPGTVRYRPYNEFVNGNHLVLNADTKYIAIEYRTGNDANLTWTEGAAPEAVSLLKDLIIISEPVTSTAPAEN